MADPKRPPTINAFPAKILSDFASLEVQVDAAWKGHQVVVAAIIAFAVGVIIGLML